MIFTCFLLFRFEMLKLSSNFRIVILNNLINTVILWLNCRQVKKWNMARSDMLQDKKSVKKSINSAIDRFSKVPFFQKQSKSENCFLFVCCRARSWDIVKRAVLCRLFRPLFSWSRKHACFQRFFALNDDDLGQAGLLALGLGKMVRVRIWVKGWAIRGQGSS